jgi:hypothetical protein
MFKKLATFSLVILLFLLAYGVQTIESQEDYSYVLGVWELTTKAVHGTYTSEITVKEILTVENKAVIFAKWPDIKVGKNFSAAGSYEVNDALFKPGPEPVIEYKAPVNGREISLKFNKNGTGTTKSVSTGGGESGTLFGDLKKNEAGLWALSAFSAPVAPELKP